MDLVLDVCKGRVLEGRCNACGSFVAELALLVNQALKKIRKGKSEGDINIKKRTEPLRSSTQKTRSSGFVCRSAAQAAHTEAAQLDSS
jgi:hypothetical protein